jgi:hypothetical protein
LEDETSAWEEVAATGVFGESALRPLHRTIRSELARLPILLEDRPLSDDLAWDFVQDFFVARGQRVMSAQLAESDDAAISLLRLAGRTNIAQALRHNARNPNRPLQLLGLA